MKRNLSLLILLALPFMALAQDFISYGTITYERRVNIWSNVSQNFFQDFKNNVPEWETTEFALTFSPVQSLYSPKINIQKRVTTPPSYDNIVYSDLKNRLNISYKNVFENKYLIHGALRDAVWKIKDDFREIAGFNCRRATTMLFDSVFVVAFYTDKIMSSTGPEGFNGLPGTILGLVINQIHTTWYATKVETNEKGGDLQIIPPSNGKKVSLQEFEALLPDITTRDGKLNPQLVLFSEI